MEKSCISCSIMLNNLLIYVGEKMTHIKINIDATLIKKLIAEQFPQWKDLTIQPVATSGWDNRTFHLGSEMLIRMPSDSIYEPQVEKEQQWLPHLATFLPLAIPQPLAVGQPSTDYPYKWSIYKWIEGEPLAQASSYNREAIAKQLGKFIVALHEIETKDGPPPGPHNFYRGGTLVTYDTETRNAIKKLKDKIDAKKAIALWEEAISTVWSKPPVWIHGDISAGNLILRDGQLHAVIDFGQLGVGDPACDLAITWTFFEDRDRDIFRSIINLDDDTWMRGRGWTLWKSLLYITNDQTSMNYEAKRAWHTIDALLK